MASVKCDSRLVEPGDTFVAIRGVTQDGTRYIDAALAAGAAEIVTELPRPASGIPISVNWRTVDDARVELARIACIAFRDPSKSLDVFGVTGTNGKTTTATLMRKILNEAGRPAGLVSTITNITQPAPKRSLFDRLLGREPALPPETVSVNTTPGPVELQALFAEMLAKGCKSAVIEISSHAIDQHRVEGTRFAAIAFTNLTQDHLDYHTTMEAYFDAKRALFVPFQARAAINIDCPYGRRLFSEIKPLQPGQVLSYGSSRDADVRFSQETLTQTGSTFQLDFPGGSQHVEVHLLGRHNLHNILAAFSMALLNGIPSKPAIAALASALPIRGRLERVSVDVSPASCFVDYAHTSDAIENVLETLREITPGRLFIVFGAGGDRDRQKRPLMGEVARRLADCVIITSDNPRSETPAAIIDDILSGIPDYQSARMENGDPTIYVQPDRRQAIQLAVRLANQPGDAVLVAGKGHETDQVFADRRIHFDDREELMEAGQ